jgi:hypothetical protein
MYTNYAQPGNPLTAFTFAEANTYVNNLISSLNSGGAGERSIEFTIINNNYNPTTGGFFNTFEIQDTIQIRGEVVLQSGPAANQTNEIVYPFQQWFIAYDRYFPPTPQDGTPSAAFGFSALGGTEGNPQPSTFVASVAVNPGQTYTITVGQSGGAVQFQFTQG